MTEKDRLILEFVKIAEGRCRKMAYKYHISGDDFDDWVGNATVQVVAYADKIASITDEKDREAYICAICKYHKPKYHAEECRIPVNDDDEELEDLVFVDDRNAEKALTAEPEKQTTLEMYKQCKQIVKRLGGDNQCFSFYFYNQKTGGRHKGVRIWNLIMQKNLVN